MQTSMYQTKSIAECQDCFSPGNCQGSVLQSTIVNSDCECQDACAAAAGCTDFTYDSSNSICTLTSDCPTVGSCETCVNGPKVCSTTTPQPNTTATPPGKLTYRVTLVV